MTLAETILKAAEDQFVLTIRKDWSIAGGVELLMSDETGVPERRRYSKCSLHEREIKAAINPDGLIAVHVDRLHRELER